MKGGLKYKELTAGKGPAGKRGSKVSCKYVLRLKNDKVRRQAQLPALPSTAAYKHTAAACGGEHSRLRWRAQLPAPLNPKPCI